MTEIVCPGCQRFLPGGPGGAPGEPVTVRCPECGGELTYRVDSSARTGTGSWYLDEPGAFETVFQPRLGLLFDAAEPSRGTLPPGAPPPPRREASEALLEDLEASGRSYPLTGAHTEFGGAGADVDLGDPSLSDPAFRVEIVGREWFLRDLGGRLETLLNGRRIGYAELLPGDEIRVGRHRLRFRRTDEAVS